MRNRPRKTNRGVPREVLVMAATEVEDRGRSVRGVARNFGICHVTLNRYVREHKKLQEAGSLQLPAVGYNSHRKVFNAEQERELSDYLTTASTMYFGLRPREVRKLAFQCAKTFGCVYPESWNSNEMAGQEWFTSFLKRNPKLSIHCQEATSLSRATNVSSFFTNLATVLEKYAFEAKDIWNSDETGVTMVQAPEKVVASKGTKQAMIYGEKGSLVTVAVAVNAQGDSIPPIFIFPQKKYRTNLICGAPKGSIGAANHSGWMQEEEFLFFLHHFVHHTRASSASKVLLLLDNHTSHVSVACVDFCKENGVVLLTFPPHCSHTLQPLDRSVFGPFKRKISTCMDNWMKSHPGATATVCDLPDVVAQALPTPQNIVAGFRCAGIWPFNDAVFTDADFSSGFINGRPAGTTVPTAAPAEPFAAAALPEPAITAATGSCASNMSPLPAGGLSPVAARPFPKAEPRKSSAKKKTKKRVRAILTDSRVKRTLEEEAGKKKKSGPSKTKRRLGLTPQSKNRPTHQAGQENCPFLVREETFDASGHIELQLWEDQIGSTAMMTADLQGLSAGEKDLSDDELALSPVTGQISGVEITVTWRCRRCQKTQSNFEVKARFHRCENCRMLQKSSMYLSSANGTLDVLGEYGDQNVLISNSDEEVPVE